MKNLILITILLLLSITVKSQIYFNRDLNNSEELYKNVTVYEYNNVSFDIGSNYANGSGEIVLMPTWNAGFLHKNLYGFNYRVSYVGSNKFKDQLWVQTGFQYRLTHKYEDNRLGSLIVLYPAWFKGYIGGDRYIPTSLAINHYGNFNISYEFMIGYTFIEHKKDDNIQLSFRISKFFKSNPKYNY